MSLLKARAGSLLARTGQAVVIKVPNGRDSYYGTQHWLFICSNCPSGDRHGYCCEHIEAVQSLIDADPEMLAWNYFEVDGVPSEDWKERFARLDAERMARYK